MAYETLSWDDIGYPNGEFRPVRRSPTLRQGKEAGYTVTRPMFTRDLWVFYMSWSFMYEEQYINLVEFFHSMRGGTLFYLDAFFTGLYGLPDKYGGLAVPGSTEPFDTEIDSGYGEGPIFLVRFGIEELEASLIKAPQNYWTVNNVIFEQV